jgi:uncharacterized lipoprotein YajG
MKTTRPLLLALAVLAGCATPPDYFHTLRPAAVSSSAPTMPRACSRSDR